MNRSGFRILDVDATNAQHVGTMFRAIYGEDFPARIVYEPEQLWREIQQERLFAALAFSEEGEPIAYLSFFKSAPNPRLWEAGNMMVVPAYAQTDVGMELASYGLEQFKGKLRESDGLFGEAVCSHYFTQVNGIKSGMVDCALELNQLDGSSFKDGKNNKAGLDRISCLLHFRELSQPTAEEYLPERYADPLQKLAAPLQSRSFRDSTAVLPLTGFSDRVEQYYEAAKTWKIAVRSVAGDWREFVEKTIAEAEIRQVVSLQVAVNTACPAVGAAVEVLREQGFFFCGLAPRWFGTDGVLMQKLWGDEPDYEETKLYSQTAKELMAFIRQDREAVLNGNPQKTDNNSNCR